MSRRAYIYEHLNADPDVDRFVLERDGQESLMVPVPVQLGGPA